MLQVLFALVADVVVGAKDKASVGVIGWFILYYKHRCYYKEY